MAKAISGPLAALKLQQIAAYDDDLNLAALRILVIISGYVGSENAAWPSVAKIARRLQLSRAAVTRQITILVEKGYLKKAARYDPDTKARRSNVYEINMELANIYKSQPEIFCKEHVTLIVTSLVTLLRYGVLEPNGVADDETPESCINIKPKTNHSYNKNKNNNKNKNKASPLLTKCKAVHANAWEDQVRNDEKEGITPSLRREVERLNDELREKIGSLKMTDFTLKITKEIKEKNMSALEGIEHHIACMKRKLENLQQE